MNLKQRIRLLEKMKWREPKYRAVYRKSYKGARR